MVHGYEIPKSDLDILFLVVCAAVGEEISTVKLTSTGRRENCDRITRQGRKKINSYGNGRREEMK